MAKEEKRWHPTDIGEAAEIDISNYFSLRDQVHEFLEREDVELHDKLEAVEGLASRVNDNYRFSDTMKRLNSTHLGDDFKESIAKGLGHLDESGQITNAHYETRLQEKVKVGDTEVVLREHARDKLFDSAVAILKGAGEDPSELLKHEHEDEKKTKQYIMERADRLLGLNSREQGLTLSSLYQSLDNEGLQKLRMRDFYDILDKTIENAHRGLGSRIVGQALPVLNNVYKDGPDRWAANHKAASKLLPEELLKEQGGEIRFGSPMGIYDRYRKLKEAERQQELQLEQLRQSN